MKTMFKAIFLATGILGASTALPGIAAAQQQAATSIVVVDMNDIISQSAAWKAAAPQLKAKADSAQAWMQSTENQIKAELDSIRNAQKSNTMAPDALEAKGQAWEQRRQKFATDVQARNEDLNRAQNYAIQQVTNAAAPIIQTIMRERGASIALNSGAAFAYAPSVDITKDVITRLDQSLKSISINPPAQQQPKK